MNCLHCLNCGKPLPAPGGAYDVCPDCRATAPIDVDAALRIFSTLKDFDPPCEADDERP
jgi:hypothetical protein